MPHRTALRSLVLKKAGLERKKTLVSKGAKERRLEEKKQRGELKHARSKRVPIEDQARDPDFDRFCLLTARGALSFILHPIYHHNSLIWL